MVANLSRSVVYSESPPPEYPPSEPPEAAPQTAFGVICSLEGSVVSRPVQPQDYVLQCVLGRRGSAKYSIGGQVHEVKPATVLWFAPHVVLPRVEATPDYSAWCGFFGAQVLGRASRNTATEFLLQGAEGGAILRRLTKVSARRLETQFDHLDATDLNTEQFAVGLEYLLLSAWAEHQKATRISELADVHPAVEKAAYILRTQPETGSMQELAHACGASASWLSRLFRQQVGISLVGYRNQSRIERFFELYGEGHRRNLTQAAYAAGFGSYAQFHRVFKEALGYSPGELKRGVHAQSGVTVQR